MKRDELRETLAWAMLDGTPFLRGNKFDALILAECCMKVVEIELKNAYSRGYYAGHEDGHEEAMEEVSERFIDRGKP